jgi:Tol biopolymer transport system component
MPGSLLLVFVASGDGPVRLWLRSLAATGAQPLAGTEGATSPFWSPDSRSIGFVAEGELKRLDIGGGSPLVLANDGFARGGGTWNADGIILFSPNNAGPLFRIPASGGSAVPATTLDRQLNHSLPQFLPDGRQFLFAASGATPDTSGIYLGSLDSAEVKRLIPVNTAGRYAPSGWLFWVRIGTLVAQRLDLDRRELLGEPVTVADRVGAFSVSASGLVAYRAGGADHRQLLWFDRAGKALGVFGAPDQAGLAGPDIAPDGRRVAVSRTVQGNNDVWLLDGTRMGRFSFEPGVDSFPLWSPDGLRIVTSSVRNDQRQILVKPSSGAGQEEKLLELPAVTTAITNDWSPDGRFVLYHSRDPQTSRDLWLLPMQGDHKPLAFLKTNFDEAAGVFSPDGRWVAYQSNQSGRYEIYVRPFAEPEAVASAAAKRRRPVAGVDDRRHVRAMAARRERAVLRRARREDDGGVNQRQWIDSGTRHAGGALSNADPWGRHGQQRRPAVRRYARRPVSDQYGVGKRRSSDHAPPELETA